MDVWLNICNHEYFCLVHNDVRSLFLCSKRFISNTLGLINSWILGDEDYSRNFAGPLRRCLDVFRGSIWFPPVDRRYHMGCLAYTSATWESLEVFHLVVVLYRVLGGVFYIWFRHCLCSTGFWGPNIGMYIPLSAIHKGNADCNYFARISWLDRLNVRTGILGKNLRTSKKPCSLEILIGYQRLGSGSEYHYFVTVLLGLTYNAVQKVFGRLPKITCTINARLRTAPPQWMPMSWYTNSNQNECYSMPCFNI